MVRFGYLYLNGRLTIYDVSLELRDGHPMYVAALSEDPSIHFVSPRAETAVQRLTHCLQAQAGRFPRRPLSPVA